MGPRGSSPEPWREAEEWRERNGAIGKKALSALSGLVSQIGGGWGR